jgi:hypothetical protein
MAENRRLTTLDGNESRKESEETCLARSICSQDSTDRSFVEVQINPGEDRKTAGDDDDGTEVDGGCHGLAMLSVFGQ